MAFRIEKSIPLPGPNVFGRRVYPLHEMEPGDSFLVPCRDEEREGRQKAIGIAARKYAQRHRRNGAPRFTTRRVEGGVRCWRIL